MKKEVKKIQTAGYNGAFTVYDLAKIVSLKIFFSHWFSDYDPDPIATLRKRRISADSVDSSGHARETMLSLMTGRTPLTASPLAKSSREGGTTVASGSGNQLTGSSLLKTGTGSGSSSKQKTSDKSHKHKKKRKHHHCNKRKHKRHQLQLQKNSSSHEDEEMDDSLKIKLDGSFNNTTTYSIRSPMYHQKSEDSNHEEDQEKSSEDEYSETEVSDESETEDETAAATATTSRKGAAK